VAAVETVRHKVLDVASLDVLVFGAMEPAAQEVTQADNVPQRQKLLFYGRDGLYVWQLLGKTVAVMVPS
jgi:hypothetical protein